MRRVKTRVQDNPGGKSRTTKPCSGSDTEMNVGKRKILAGYAKANPGPVTWRIDSAESV